MTYTRIVVFVLFSFYISVNAQLKNDTYEHAISQITHLGTLISHNNLILHVTSENESPSWLNHCDINLRSLALAPDTSYIAIGYSHGVIKLFDRAGDLLCMLPDHTDAVRVLAISPDSSYIASGSKDGTAKLWDRKGNLINSIETNHSEIIALAITPNNTVISLSAWGKLTMWNAQDNCLYSAIEPTNPMTSFAAASDASYIVTSYCDNKAKIHFNGHSVTLSGHTKPIRAIAITNDNKTIITGSADTSLKVWNAQTGLLLLTLSGHTAEITNITLTSDNSLLISCSCDKIMNVWELNSGKLMHTFLENSSIACL